MTYLFLFVFEIYSIETQFLFISVKVQLTLFFRFIRHHTSDLRPCFTMQPDCLFQQADTLLAPFRYKFYKNKELAFIYKITPEIPRTNNILTVCFSEFVITFY